MQEVNISELKARLSHYLRLAESGEEVLVKDRDRPVARLVGCVPASVDLDVPRRLPWSEAAKVLASLPRPKFSPEVIEDTLRWVRQDRSDRWFGKKRKRK